MKISDVRVRLVKNESSKIKGSASITIDDCFIVHEIKIIEGSEGYYIAMPRRKASDGSYKDIVHANNNDTRNEIKEIVLKAFEEAKAAASNE